MMPVRRILFIDATRLTAFRWHGGTVGREGEFAADAAGLADFGDYLAERRSSLYHILAEVAEEGFQHEDIPFVTGRDRIAIIKRKLAQHYFGTPLAVALSGGRRKTGRRDEAMLFSALTRPQHFEPWLEMLRQAEAPLVGIFSLPQLTPSLVAARKHPAPPCLLVTLTRGGLRQTYIEDGQLRFSRLTALASGTVEEAAAACANEAAKIYQYVFGQRQIGHDGQLPVYVLVHPAQAHAFRNRCRNTGELRFEYLDLLAEAGRLGLKTSLADSRSEALFAHLLVRNLPSSQFAPSRERRFHRLWQLRFALVGTGLAICAGGLLFAAKQFFGQRLLAERTEILRQQAEDDNRRYQTVLQSLPPIPIAAADLRLLVSRYDALQKRAVGPGPLYRRLGIALQDFPRIELDRLNWTVVNRSEDAFAGSGDRPSPAPSAAVATAGPFAVMDVYGQLPVAMANDYRGQLEIINSFADRLRTAPDMQVRIRSLPFDAESGKVLKSGGGSAPLDAPRFALRVAQKL